MTTFMMMRTLFSFVIIALYCHVARSACVADESGTQLYSPTPNFGDRYGWGVTMNNAGTLFVSAKWASPFSSKSTYMMVGSVYVYDYDNAGGWSPSIGTPELIPSDATDYYRVGQAIDVDDQHCIIGANRGNGVGSGSVYAPGSAYIFTEVSPSTWVETSILGAPDPYSISEYGFAVAISGGIAVVGAHHDASGGKIYVYFETGGTGSGVFTLAQTIAQNIYGGSTLLDREIGWSTEMHGTTAVFGAPDRWFASPGAAHVFDVSVSGAATLEATLESPNTDPACYSTAYQCGFFGSALAIYGDVIAVAAVRDVDWTGRVEIFDKHGGSWLYRQELVPTSNVLTIFDHYGGSIALYETTCLVGAGLDDDLATDAGVVYGFAEVSPGNWVESYKLLGQNAGSLFGGTYEEYYTNSQSLAITSAGIAVGGFGFSGYTGTAWTFPVDCVNDCDGHSNCLHGSVCVDNMFSYSCDCTGTGFEGTYCENDVDCNPNPCDVGQECVDAGGIGLWLCQEPNECDSSPCSPGEFCIDGTGDYTCEDINECDSSPCLNYGVCDGSGVSIFTCDCLVVGYMGEICETEIDECESSPCQHEGVCTDLLRDFTCDCTGTGYSNDVCDVEINECDSSPCENGAACIDGIAYHTCDCGFTGYTGLSCETEINDCSSSPCSNGAICTDALNAFTCDCPIGFTGELCQTKVITDACLSSPCLSNGVCVFESDGMYSCDCTGTGFYGELCQSDVDDCSSSPCLNDGACTDTGANSFDCQCGTGFDGTLCQIQTDSDDCLSSPCLNDGVCIDEGTDSYSCTCVNGFEGSNCQDDSDDCLSSPCQNDATCTDLGVNAFACECPTTHSGDLCTDVVTSTNSGLTSGSGLTSSGPAGLTSSGPLPGCDGPPLAAVTILLEIPGFVSDTPESFVAELQEDILPSAIGGTSCDYLVSVLERGDGSFEITIVSSNPDERSRSDIERTILNDPAVVQRVNGDIRITVVEDQESSAYQVGGSAAMHTLMFVLSYVFVL